MSPDSYPILLSVSTNAKLVTRGIMTYYSSFGPVENMSPQAQYLEKIGVNWAVLYSSSILATLLWCTIFIVYRILRVGGIAAGMRVYHRLVEMLVESASLYSAVIVVLLVFEVRSDAAEIYIEELVIATRVSTSNPFQLLSALQPGMRAWMTPGAKYHVVVASIQKFLKFAERQC